MKLLLYCTKSKKYNELLIRNNDTKNIFINTSKAFSLDDINRFNHLEILNGKIVGECDFEVEEIRPFFCENIKKFEKESCLTMKECAEYLKGFYGYAIHIKNLTIFDTPKELNNFYDKDHNLLTKAPQNMCYAYDMEPQDIVLFGKIIENGTYAITQEYVLISIRPEWLCKILNGEKTIEIRKKVLKEML